MTKTVIKFDEQRWREIIQKPDWYLEFVPYAKDMLAKLEGKDQQVDEFNKTIRRFFEKELEDGRVAIGDSGPNLDEQRRPVDTVVIHHTSNPKSYSLSYLNAVHLLNIYAPYYANPAISTEEGIKGQPLWSGHFWRGQQVFWGYHWLMRMDGSFERLLKDEQIGWHAGNWDVNKRSVGICLDNDYENQDPTDEILQKLAAHIQQNYADIKASNIIGHSEARSGTICPGTNFIGGWKIKLREKLV